MKRAFVSGATGFLGLNLVEELVRQGWEVVALHRPGSRLDDLRRFPVRLAAGDVGDAASLREAMPSGLDAVFHVAGDTSLWSAARARLEQVNVAGARNVVEAARARGARRLVHTSSAAAYGWHRRRIAEEAPSLAEGSWVDYLRTKRLGERIVEEAAAAGLEAVILNPTNVVGAYDRHNWSRLIRLAVRRELPGVPPGRASWCHAREVARAHVAAAERGRSGQHYLLACVDATYREMVETVGQVTGCRVTSRPVPALVLRAVARANAIAAWFTKREPDITPEGAAMAIDVTTFDSSKAQRELGYRPATLREMISDCWRWMQAAGLMAEGPRGGR
jgi:dihydroflavonol-4-reductase